MTTLSPFHLAIPVSNLEECRKFYREVLGCEEGRSSDHWVDFDFFGHQLVIHEEPGKNKSSIANPVDGKNVPVPHFGVVLNWDDWHDLANHLKKLNVKFVIEPYIRFEGQPGEQGTFFFYDPSRNALEFKAFKNMNDLFAK